MRRILSIRFRIDGTRKPAGDLNHYLSDGKVTLAVMPWKISDFYGSGIEAAGP